MFLDTSGLLCAWHRSELHHTQARALFYDAQRYLVHDHVFSELVAVTQARRLPRQPTIELIQYLIASPKVKTIFVEQILLEAALSLLNARPDKTYSLCDAISFVLMREHQESEALTSDRHFEQEGFRRLLVTAGG